MQPDRTPSPSSRHDLTPVQTAVFLACVQHRYSTFAPLTPSAWWRAEAPFRGGRAVFGTHLRALASAGFLTRRSGRDAAYDLTLRGERLAAKLSKAPK